jgi:hypothetical protein
MEELVGIVFYLVFIVGIVGYIKKKAIPGSTSGTQGKTGQPVKPAKPVRYDTFNKKSIFNESGAMPHKHETKHYTSMSDASKLPPGYILLNGEPVRVADLEGK